MAYNFKTNFWGSTEFWCDVYSGPDYKLVIYFTAYKVVGMFAKDGSSDNWIAIEDGIYFHKDSLLSTKKTNWWLVQKEKEV